MTSAFGDLRFMRKASLLAGFPFNSIGNATKNSCCYADILRTHANAVRRLPHVVWMMVAVNAQQRLDGSCKEACRLPGVSPRPHAPSDCCVLERMRTHAVNACSLASGCESLLDVPYTFAVNVQYVPQLVPRLRARLR